MSRAPSNAETILLHWREAVPNDRLAHLVKDATRALVRALQMRGLHELSKCQTIQRRQAYAQ